ncbi:MAG: hypothetical protein CMJ83_22315 [Planctomycetes bacterium]|nr:hypothetical protein [Planctomycetota bacterium]
MDTPSASFWDRHPWLGFAVFFAVISVVGGVLAVVVGERAHYRTVTEVLTVEDQGAFPADAAWKEDPVRVLVRVPVRDPQGRALAGVEVALVLRDRDEVVSNGITHRPDGVIHLPVPERLSKALFQRLLDVRAFAPGQEHIAIATVPPPTQEGLTVVELRLAKTVSAWVRVVDQDGRRLPLAGRLTCALEGRPVPRHSTGWPVLDGEARAGGLPVGRPMTLRLVAPGFAPSTTTLTLPRTGTPPFNVEVKAGPRTGR